MAADPAAIPERPENFLRRRKSGLSEQGFDAGGRHDRQGRNGPKLQLYGLGVCADMTGMGLIDRRQALDRVWIVNTDVGVDKGAAGRQPASDGAQIIKFGPVIGKMVHDKKRGCDIERLIRRKIFDTAFDEPNVRGRACDQSCEREVVRRWIDGCEVGGRNARANGFDFTATTGADNKHAGRIPRMIGDQCLGQTIDRVQPGNRPLKLAVHRKPVGSVVIWCLVDRSHNVVFLGEGRPTKVEGQPGFSGRAGVIHQFDLQAHTVAVAHPQHDLFDL